MTSAWLLSLAALMCQMSVCAAQHWRTALYPSAFRVKRGTPALLDPFLDDANLLYEVLWTGARVDGALSVMDQELASMRKLQVLEVLCEDVLPHTLSDIQRLGSRLDHHRGSLRVEDFERTVLTMVLAAQRLQHIRPRHQRELWAATLLNLYRAVKGDLRLE